MINDLDDHLPYHVRKRRRREAAWLNAGTVVWAGSVILALLLMLGVLLAVGYGFATKSSFAG